MIDVGQFKLLLLDKAVEVGPIAIHILKLLPIFIIRHIKDHIDLSMLDGIVFSIFLSFRIIITTCSLQQYI